MLTIVVVITDAPQFILISLTKTIPTPFTPLPNVALIYLMGVGRTALRYRFARDLSDLLPDLTTQQHLYNESDEWDGFLIIYAVFLATYDSYSSPPPVGSVIKMPIGTIKMLRKHCATALYGVVLTRRPLPHPDQTDHVAVFWVNVLLFLYIDRTPASPGVNMITFKNADPQQTATTRPHRVSHACTSWLHCLKKRLSVTDFTNVSVVYIR